MCVVIWDDSLTHKKIKLLLHYINMASYPLLNPRTYLTSPPVPPFTQTIKIKPFKEKKKRIKGVHHIIQTPAHGCSPVCQPMIIWRDSWFMSNSLQSGRNVLPRGSGPVPKRVLHFGKQPLVSFVLDICVLICVWWLTKEPHIIVDMLMINPLIQSAYQC